MRAILSILLVAAWASWTMADSLFSDETEKRGSLVTDSKKKFEVGDIITVLVRETIDASTQADTRTEKESTLEAQASPAQNPFLIAETPGGLNILPEEQLPNWDIGIENEHEARGRTLSRSKLVMAVGCKVVKVHENGNLDIEGDKQVTVNREDSRMHIKGTVRSKDVSPANTIDSSQVANAVIELKGRGPLWNNQRRGLLTRLLDWFSPF